ncbi:MAG TPA: hypothetical protein VGD05_07590, partial [Pyrinomonadaceae bacterium]
MIAFYFIQKIIKFFIRLIFGESSNTERNSTAATVLLLGLVVVLIFGLIANSCQSCRENRNHDKLNEINANQSNINAGTIVIEQQKANINAEVKNAEQNTKNANAETGNTFRRDSNSYNGDSADAKF